MESIQKRESYLDMAKALGIILVVYAHLIAMEQLSGLLWLVKYIYAFHMPLFFFISGCCLCIKEFSHLKISCWNRISKIFCRLLWPYLIWSLIYLFISGGLFSPERLKAIFTLRGIAPIWFLGALALCEIFFILIQIVTKQMNNIGRLWIHIAIAVFVFFAGYALNSVKHLPELTVQSIGTVKFYLFTSIYRFFVSFGIVECGYLYTKLNILHRFSKVINFIGGSFLLGFMVIILRKNNLHVNLHTAEISNYNIFVCTALLGSLGIIMISYSISCHCNIINYLGRNSLGIMVLHYSPFLTIPYGFRVARYIVSNDFGASVLGTLFVLLICILGIWLCKKSLYIGN